MTVFYILQVCFVCKIHSAYFGAMSSTVHLSFITDASSRIQIRVEQKRIIRWFQEPKLAIQPQVKKSCNIFCRIVVTETTVFRSFGLPCKLDQGRHQVLHGFQCHGQSVRCTEFLPRPGCSTSCPRQFGDVERTAS